ncbi:MAG TPA: hypothetical protein VII93_11990, partial [Anaerolineales bacterium]
PSFLDQFMNFVGRLPFPYWLTYLVLFFLQSILFHTLAWIVSWLPPFKFNPILFVFPLWIWGSLVLMTHLNRVALEAVADFSPLLKVDEEQMDRIKVEFTVMPARGVILSTVIWSIIYLGLTLSAFKVFYVAFGMGAFFSAVITVEGLISFSVCQTFWRSWRFTWMNPGLQIDEMGMT